MTPSNLQVPHRRPPAVRPRGARHWQGGLVAALLALVAQATLPQLHLWQTSAHHPAQGQVSVGGRDGATARLTELRTSDRGNASSEHAESRCPVCQTIAQSRSFLVLATIPPLPIRTQLTTAEPQPAWRTSARVAAHAPRSPPLAA
jgi:hypothetical protein